VTYPGQGQPPDYQQGYPQGAPQPAGYPQPAGHSQPGYPQSGPPAPGYPQAGYPQGYYTVPANLVPYAPNGMPLASFGDRFLAYLIDGAVNFGVALVLGVPLFIAFFAIIAGSSDVNSDSAGPSVALILLLYLAYFVAIIAWGYIYHVEMFQHSGVTWGKRAMKLKIIRLDDPAAPPTRGTVAKRWAVQNIGGFVVPFFSYVDNLWQLWDKPYQQCLHDKAAGTIVVKAG